MLSLVVAVIGGAIAVGIVAVQHKTYESTAVLAIDQPRVLAETTDVGEVAKLASLRVKYAGLATTLQFAGLVSAEAGLPAAAVHGAVVTSVPPDSLLLSIGARTDTESQAQPIARALAHGLSEFVRRQDKSAQVPLGQGLQLNVVTPAGAPVKVSPTTNRELGAGGITAAIIFVLALSVQTLRRRD
jgi:capsular polysaccharide biosynthesis protein